jgi:hypothetical protein
MGRRVFFFGATPIERGAQRLEVLGPDHHPRAFTMWMAGGGIKPGVSVGKTDELGYNVARTRPTCTTSTRRAVHLMGIDHTRLTYRFQGRDFRLTDVSGRVIEKLLA